VWGCACVCAAGAAAARGWLGRCGLGGRGALEALLDEESERHGATARCKSLGGLQYIRNCVRYGIEIKAKTGDAAVVRHGGVVGSESKELQTVRQWGRTCKERTEELFSHKRRGSSVVLMRRL